jgi:hypothetical protein
MAFNRSNGENQLDVNILQQLVASFGAAQAGGGAMKCTDGRGAFLVMNRFTCFVTRDLFISMTYKWTIICPARSAVILLLVPTLMLSSMPQIDHRVGESLERVVDLVLVQMGSLDWLK